MTPDSIPTTDQLAMRRRIVASVKPPPRDFLERVAMEQAALAAIIETSREIAEALRSGTHLKGQTNDD